MRWLRARRKLTCSRKTNVVMNWVIHNTEKASPEPAARCVAGNSSDGSRHATGPSPMPKAPTKPTIAATQVAGTHALSLIHISEPTRRTATSYAVFCLKKYNCK